MSTQGSAPHVPLPEDIKQAISIASAKVAVLNEDEKKLIHVKLELEKDIARLEIRRDDIVEKTLPLADLKDKAEAELEKIVKDVEDARSSCNALNAEIATATKDIEDTRAEIAVEAAKLSTIVSQSRDAQVDLDARRATVKALEEGIEARKARIQDALATL